jgi:hypothetical protein
MNIIKKDVKEKDNFSDIPVDSGELGFSVKVINGAQILKITTFGQLISASKERNEEFMSVFGKKSRDEIHRKIMVKTATHLSVVRNDR